MGVPYLSEQEEVEARERYDQRIERNAAIPSIVFDPSDVGTLEFYRRARSIITEWIEAKEVSNFLFIIIYVITFSIFQPIVLQKIYYLKDRCGLACCSC